MQGEPPSDDMDENTSDHAADALRFARGVHVNMSDLQFSFSRSGGPGGQAVNKLNTRAELRLSVDAIQNLADEDRRRLERLAGRFLTTGGELVITSQTHRSQHANRRECVERLRDLITRSLHRPPKRVATRPSRAARERRLQRKQQTAEKKRQRRRPDPE